MTGPELILLIIVIGAIGFAGAVLYTLCDMVAAYLNARRRPAKRR